MPTSASASPASTPELSRFAPGAALRSAKPINRFEIKYLVHHSVAREIVGALSGYATPDPHGEGEWGYRVYSVYWDSPDLRCFWEKVEGVSFRRKLRVRRYGSARDVFVEIKQRIDRTLQKRRVRCPLEQALALLDPQAAESAAPPEAGGAAAEIACFQRTHALRPRMAISYRRRAFFGVYEPDLRITFDTRVQYSAAHLDMARPFDAGKYVVDPRLAIMEVKFSERVPRWLCTLLNARDLQMTRLSKYCTAVDREYFQGRVTPLL